MDWPKLKYNMTQNLSARSSIIGVSVIAVLYSFVVISSILVDGKHEKCMQYSSPRFRKEHIQENRPSRCSPRDFEYGDTVEFHFFRYIILHSLNYSGDYLRGCRPFAAEMTVMISDTVKSKTEIKWNYFIYCNNNLKLAIDDFSSVFKSVGTNIIAKSTRRLLSAKSRTSINLIVFGCGDTSSTIFVIGGMRSDTDNLNASGTVSYAYNINKEGPKGTPCRYVIRRVIADLEGSKLPVAFTCVLCKEEWKAFKKILWASLTSICAYAGTIGAVVIAILKWFETRNQNSHN